MKRKTLALICACLVYCGCAGRVDTDLLQARIREQSIQLAESEREIAKTRAELKRARQEAERLQSELVELGSEGPAVAVQTSQIDRIHIHSLASGGLNKDDQPGDDAVVIQFVPIDTDGEPLKVPGEVEFRLTDPRLAQPERQIGYWIFSAEECHNHWTRGITSSGYQFTLPLQTLPQHTDLVLHLSFRTSDQRELSVSQVVKVVPSTKSVLAITRKSISSPAQSIEESDETLPPVGEGHSSGEDEHDSDWSDEEEEQKRPALSRRAILHSANWTDATIPQLR